MRFILLAALALAVDASSQLPQPKAIPDNWITIDELNFTIQYPDTFDLDKSKQMGTSFIAFTKQTSSKDLFRENINLLQQNLGGQMISLDEFVKLSEEQIKTLITNASIISSQRMKSKDSEFHQVVFSGDQGQFHLKFQQHYWLSNGIAYILTFTSEISQFEKYQPVGEAIMKSFQLK